MELFTPEFGLVFWMFVAFLCLYFILAKYAWPYIIKTMEERADKIDKGVAVHQEAEAKLANAEIERVNIIAEANNEKLEILSEAKKRGNDIIEEARGKALAEAKRVAQAAQLSIEQSRKESEQQLRQEAGMLALEIAEKVIRQNISNDAAQKELVDKYLKEAQANN